MLVVRQFLFCRFYQTQIDERLMHIEKQEPQLIVLTRMKYDGFEFVLRQLYLLPRTWMNHTIVNMPCSRPQVHYDREWQHLPLTSTNSSFLSTTTATTCWGVPMTFWIRVFHHDVVV